MLRITQQQGRKERSKKLNMKNMKRCPNGFVATECTEETRFIGSVYSVVNKYGRNRNPELLKSNHRAHRNA